MEQIREYKIYKLNCITTNLIYIGHTKNSLEKRLSDHKSNKKSTSQYLLDPQIKLLEIIKTTKEDCLLCEKYYINLYNEKYPALVVNHNQPLRDSLEWYYDNRQRILEQKKNLYNLDKQKYINRMSLRYHKKCYINELNKEIYNSKKLKRHQEKIEILSNIFH
tara:strand:- start:3002 stop:3490 length:489 start_codon:yes stop_codon:yes gene_type:complete